MNRIINNDYGDILAWGRNVSMCFLPVRLRDGQLDEKERQERENGRLEKSDEYLEHHKWHRKEVGHEIRRDENDDLAGEDVAEEPERERAHADQFADELDQPHRKPYRGASSPARSSFSSQRIS